MHYLAKALTATAIGLVISAQTYAHGLWTEQRRSNIEVVYGHGAEDDAFKAEKVRGAWAYNQAGKMVPVTIERLTDHVRLVPLRQPASLFVALDNGLWAQKPDQKWVNEGKIKVPDAIEASHSFKYSLAIYQPGAHIQAPKNVHFVILPEVDPLSVGPGKKIPVQVLLDGKPAANISLIGDYRGAPHVVSAKTDANGRATLEVRNEGLNIIAAHTTQAVANDPDINRFSYFTSLTFLGETHHE